MLILDVMSRKRWQLSKTGAKTSQLPPVARLQDSPLTPPSSVTSLTWLHRRRWWDLLGRLLSRPGTTPWAHAWTLQHWWGWRTPLFPPPGSWILEEEQKPPFILHGVSRRGIQTLSVGIQPLSLWGFPQTPAKSPAGVSCWPLRSFTIFKESSSSAYQPNTCEDYSLDLEARWPLRSAVRTPTIGDECSTREHFAKHELDDGQDDARQAANDGHAEQESVLTDRQEHRGEHGSLCWNHNAETP